MHLIDCLSIEWHVHSAHLYKISKVQAMPMRDASIGAKDNPLQGFGGRWYALIDTFQRDSYYIVSLHKVPYPSFSHFTNHLAPTVWFMFGLTLYVILFLTFLSGILFRRKIDVSEVILRVLAGFFNSEMKLFFPGIMTTNELAGVWLFAAFSFIHLYSIEFRSSLIAQRFPPPIEHFQQTDILKDGFYIHPSYIFDLKELGFSKLISDIIEDVTSLCSTCASFQRGSSSNAACQLSNSLKVYVSALYHDFSTSNNDNFTNHPYCQLTSSSTGLITKLPHYPELRPTK